MEFWYARDLQEVLQYTQWRNFQNVIDRAMLACKNSGYNVAEHFAEVIKTLEMPNSALKAVENEELKKLRKQKAKLQLDE